MQRVLLRQEKRIRLNLKRKLDYALVDRDSLLKRLKEKLVPIGDCLLYGGAKNKDSRPNISVSAKGLNTTLCASRVAYVIHTGKEFDYPADACHKDDICISKACCNVEHLFWGTHSKNMKQVYEEKSKPVQRLLPQHFPTSEISEDERRLIFVERIRRQVTIKRVREWSKIEQEPITI